MSAITSLSLVSGLHISAPLEQLRAFCAEEYVYYDAIPSAAPDHVLPLDVLVTVAVNSFVNDAKSIRLVHRGLAQRCDPLLARIPEDVNLLESPSALAVVGDLLAAALDAKRVLVPVATKVLHRKRRALIPMLDSVIIEHYRPGYAAKMQDKKKPGDPGRAQACRAIADRAVEVLKAFRTDLQQAAGELAALRAALAVDCYDLTPVRILELLVWMRTEPNQYYVPHATSM